MNEISIPKSEPMITEDLGFKAVQLEQGRVVFSKMDSRDTTSGCNAWHIGASGGKVDIVLRPRHKGMGTENPKINQLSQYIENSQNLAEELPGLCHELLEIEDSAEKSHQIGVMVASACIAVQQISDTQKIASIASNVHETIQAFTGISKIY